MAFGFIAAIPGVVSGAAKIADSVGLGGGDSQPNKGHELPLHQFTRIWSSLPPHVLAEGTRLYKAANDGADPPTHDPFVLQRALLGGKDYEHTGANGPALLAWWLRVKAQYNPAQAAGVLDYSDAGVAAPPTLRPAGPGELNAFQRAEAATGVPVGWLIGGGLLLVALVLLALRVVR